jgi:hypothetical protein
MIGGAPEQVPHRRGLQRNCRVVDSSLGRIHSMPRCGSSARTAACVGAAISPAVRLRQDDPGLSLVVAYGGSAVVERLSVLVVAEDLRNELLQAGGQSQSTRFSAWLSNVREWSPSDH